MYNMKIISLKATFMYEFEFDGMLSITCMSYIIALTCGQNLPKKCIMPYIDG